MIAKLNKAVMILSIGLVISLVGCIVFAYLWIDRSISLSYLAASQDSTVSAFNKVSFLLENEWVGVSKQELLEKLKAEASHWKDQEIVIDDDSDQEAIWFDEVKFEFESGKLKRVSM